AGEAQPAAEQPAVAPEGEEEVRGVGAGDEPRRAGEEPVDQPDVGPGAGRDPGRGLDRRRHEGTAGSCGVVSSTRSCRATSSAGPTRRRTTRSTTGWAMARIGRIGRT